MLGAAEGDTIMLGAVEGDTIMLGAVGNVGLITQNLNYN
jgi:hypothetical protein